MNGASKDYDFGPKNNWRRAVWNEVLRRTNGREKELPILYLAGPDDHDRRIACAKGVPNQNLIAIDRDPQNVLSVRDHGNPAVRAEMLDVLWSWPKERPVAAVLLDFCCGLEFEVTGIYDAFEREPLREAVVMVNFMRGRDPWSKTMREQMESILSLLPRLPPGVSSPKHRACQFLTYHAVDIFSTVNGLGTGALEVDDITKQGRARILLPDTLERVMPVIAFLTLMAPRFFSYRSGALVFDSAVFFSHAAIAAHVERAGETAQAREWFVRHFGPRDWAEDERRRKQREASWRVPAVIRRVAATLAIRSMRIAKKVADV